MVKEANDVWHDSGRKERTAFIRASTQSVYAEVCRLKVRYTLKKNSDFRRLYTRGKSAVNPFLVVYCRRNREGVNRLGYTVSVKLGHAVVRNRVRRRLREIVRLNSPKLKSGWDIVVVARPRCADAEYRQLERAFLQACGKLDLTREAEE